MREESAAIRTRRDKGVEDIDGPDDLREFVDITAFEPVGIPLPVPSLVRLADHIGQPLPFRTQLPDQLVAQLRMLLDQRPLFVRQPAGLRHDRLRHGEQPDIVDESGQRQPLEFIPIVAQTGSDLRGKNADVDQVRHQAGTGGTCQSLHHELVIVVDRVGNVFCQRREALQIDPILALNRRGHRRQLFLGPEVYVCRSSFFHSCY